MYNNNGEWVDYYDGHEQPYDGGVDHGDGSPQPVFDQNSPRWTPPGPGWLYLEGIGWRYRPGGLQAGDPGHVAPPTDTKPPAGDPGQVDPPGSPPNSDPRPPVIPASPPPPGVGVGAGVSEADGRAHDAANGLRGGYMTASGWVSGSPSGGGGGGNGGNFNPIPFGGSGGPRANFSQVPEFNGPLFTPPPNFKYNGQAPGQFQAPTAAAMANEPGFQFRMDQGRKALEQSAAAKGTLRSGGTLQNVLNYGQNFASNEYSNVYNRAAGEHDRVFNEYKFDYDKQADTYATNYGVKRDTYDRDFQAAKESFAPRLRGWEVNSAADQRAAELRFQREWDQYVFGEDLKFKKEDRLFNAGNKP